MQLEIMQCGVEFTCNSALGTFITCLVIVKHVCYAETLTYMQLDSAAHENVRYIFNLYDIHVRLAQRMKIKMRTVV